MLEAVLGDVAAGVDEAEEALARERALVLEHLPRVRWLVQRLAQRLPPSIDRDELVQSGALGLIDAVRRFDPAQGCSFATYAEIRVRGAVLDQLRALDDVPRKARCALRTLDRVRREVEQREGRSALADEIAAQLGTSRERFEALRARLAQVELRPRHATGETNAEPPVPWTMGAESEGADPVRALDAQLERAAVQRALAALPEAEREIVRLTYWEELSLDAVARRLRLDVCRVRTLHTRGLLRLRTRLRDRFE